MCLEIKESCNKVDYNYKMNYSDNMIEKWWYSCLLEEMEKLPFIPYNIISLDEFYTPKNQLSNEETRVE